ncbi:MAG: hypothetical protein ACK559_25545, partial [bacterium]
LHHRLLELCELLGHRQLLLGDARAHPDELGDALGVLGLGVARGAAHHAGTGGRVLRVLHGRRARDGREGRGHGNGDGVSEVHRILMGRGTKVGTCLPSITSSARRIWLAAPGAGSHFQPSSVGRPMPASPLGLRKYACARPR